MKLVIFESHPVQYHAPVYRELHRLCVERNRGAVEVCYATDISLRGQVDPGFGRSIAWDEPLTEGYPCTVMRNEKGTPLRGFRSLSGRGVDRVIRTQQPAAVLLTGLGYEFEWAALVACRRLGIPLWIRQETQDQAFARGPAKELLRRLLYRLLYRQIDHAFYIGELNRQHFLRHGVSPSRMSRCPYCAPDRFSRLSGADKERMRKETRERYRVQPQTLLAGFCGKLIPKKDPELLLRAVHQAVASSTRPMEVLLVGSGELEPRLRALAGELCVKVHFVGFVNQRDLAPYYLAMDILVLPSRRMGETWGLVVNEALHAGCSAVLSDAVGCGAEFGSWERVRVFREGDADACARRIVELTPLPRSFDWAERRLRDYSVDAAAAAIAWQMEST
jgi:glycosyltransferase involved in cell wall biosynthesis